MVYVHMKVLFFLALVWNSIFLVLVVLVVCMVKGTITTGPDPESGTVLFKSEDTPSYAYEVLTDAVLRAQDHPKWAQVDTEAIPPHTELGIAQYDEDSETVTMLRLRTEILKDYGHQA